MTYEIYRYIFYGGLILSALMFITSVALFFVLRIPNVIGDLTGANARKAIEDIRNQNEQSGVKTYMPSAVNRERGKLTDKISQSGRLLRYPSGGMGGGHSTAKISTQQLDPEMQPADETTVLQPMDETTVLQPAMAETTVLNTMVLENPETSVLPEMAQIPVFAVELDITYIHTNEIIE